MKRFFFIILFAIAGIGCQSEGPSAEKGVGSSGGGLVLQRRWPDTPIPFFISKGVPDRFAEPILDSFLQWEEEVGAALFVYKGRDDSIERRYDGRNVVYWSREPSPKNYLGETFFRVQNHETVLESDIVLYGDPEKFASLTCQEEKTNCLSSQGKFDITTTVLHEIGHFLGLEHSSVKGVIMNPDFGVNNVVRHFDGDVVAGLQLAYHLRLVLKE